MLKRTQAVALLSEFSLGASLASSAAALGAPPVSLKLGLWPADVPACAFLLHIRQHGAGSSFAAGTIISSSSCVAMKLYGF
jgi:hypothetical protein